MDLEPKPIIKLDESVVNRIAAGEIIQRPANALKELIENCLDAKSKNIQVTVKSGGMKFLQISDNGTGILKENMSILCERFTTSKLVSYDDLQSISTYGFRGEALASISMISRLSIQTKTRKEPCAYKAYYEDGIMKEGPISCAGNQGTIITIEDLFYNVPIRQKTLKLHTEEFQKVYDVVAKYAVHNYHVGFSLKKFSETNAIKTQPGKSPVDNIRIIYGNTVARSLLLVECSDDNLKYKMSASISKADYSGKKSNFLLFINHRLVESKSLKKAIFDDVYNSLLPNHVHPFIYMSIDIEPDRLDINVHPTKSEVHFLNEELIVEQIKDIIESKLLETQETRKLYTQQLLPGASEIMNDKSFDEKDRSYAKDMIRTDSKSQTIVKYFNQQGCHNQSLMNSSSQIIASPTNMLKSKKLKVTEALNSTQLTSILELRKEFENHHDEGLRLQLEKLKYVGCASKEKALIQCENILYICNTQNLIRELFYQQLITNFEQFDDLKLDEPLDIKELAMLGLQMKDCEWIEADGSKEDLSEHIQNILLDHRVMLREYFHIGINGDGQLEYLPLIIPKYMPIMSQLPIFIIRLATDVNYDEEKECFRKIASETASFYSRLSLTSENIDHNYLTEHVLYPEIRRSLLPPAKFNRNGTFLKMTSLQELYKVFERC